MSFTETMLSGKVALITGAGRGNGAAIARGMARHGATPVLVDLDATALETTGQALRDEGFDCHWHVMDVTSEDDCQRVRDAVAATPGLGGIDILVNNAGVRPRHAFDAENRDQQWRWAMEVNLDGIRRCTLIFLDSLKARRGTVINVTSIAAFNASPHSMAYSTSKAAAGMLSKVLASELAADGIRVNAVAPGVIETEMTEFSRSRPERRDWLLSRIPLARFGQPDELVGAVLFLSSDMASYVTGCTIPVDGGYLAI